MRSQFWLAVVIVVPLLATALAAPQPLFDARLSLDGARITGAEARHVRAALVPALTAEGNPGQTAPDFRIIDRAKGSFTAPKTAQVAYLYSWSWLFSNTYRQGVAVFEGGRLVRHISYNGSDYAIGTLPDINRDAMDEIVVAGGVTLQGQTLG